MGKRAAGTLKDREYKRFDRAYRQRSYLVKAELRTVTDALLDLAMRNIESDPALALACYKELRQVIRTAIVYVGPAATSGRAATEALKQIEGLRQSAALHRALVESRTRAIVTPAQVVEDNGNGREGDAGAA